MNYPFTSKIRRILCCTLVIALMTVSLSGCFSKKEPETTDEPTIDMPNLVESTDPAETEPATEPTQETEPEKQNIATVKEQLNVRPSPSTGANVTAQLDAGDQVEVLRVEAVNSVNWAYIIAVSSDAKGWVAADLLDLSNVSEAITGNNTSTPAGSDPDKPSATEPTSPASGNTNPSGTGTYGVITASELNIRSEASSNSDRVGSYTYGDRITITETKNGWGHTNKGWVSLDYVYVDGENGKNTCSGTVTASQLIVRSGPGQGYDRVNALNQGARVDVLEQIKVGGTYWGCIKGGWICMDYVSGNGNLSGGNSGTTNPGSNGGNGIGTAVVTGNGLNVRSGAGTNYDTVGALKQGETVTVYEKKDVDGRSWGRITFNGNDNCWICLDYVRMT